MREERHLGGDVSLFHASVLLFALFQKELKKESLT